MFGMHHPCAGLRLSMLTKPVRTSRANRVVPAWALIWRSGNLRYERMGRLLPSERLNRPNCSIILSSLGRTFHVRAINRSRFTGLQLRPAMKSSIVVESDFANSPRNAGPKVGRLSRPLFENFCAF
jgi:hypothetical protein